MASINRPYHPSSDEEEDDDDAEEHGAAADSTQGDACLQLPATSCLPRRQPQSKPTSPSTRAVRAPTSESNSLALIPFTGPFPGFPIFRGNAAVAACTDASAQIKGSAREDSPAEHDPSVARLGRPSAANDLDRDAERKSDTKEHKKRSKNWTRAETLTLIRLRTEFAARFAKAGRKSELWDQIAQSMQQGPFSRDAQQCRDKWEKLIASYKEVRVGVKHKDDNPYFEDLHPLLSSRISKRGREPDVSRGQHHSATPEVLNKTTPTIVDDALHPHPHPPPPPPPPPPHQRLRPVRNVAADAHHMHPFKAVMVDTHHGLLTGIAAEVHHPHNHTVLENLAIDGRFPPAFLDGFSFNRLVAETHFPRTAALGSRNVPGTGNGEDDDDVDSEDWDHPKKRRKGSERSTVADLRMVQGLVESMLAKQQVFFKELLDRIEKEEELRERRRWEREEKWRAEERSQHLFFTETMRVLLQKLGNHNGIVEHPPLGVSTPVPADCMRPVCSPAEASFVLKKRSKNWKRSEVLQLIKLRVGMEEKFAMSSRRAALWVELAATLGTEGVRRDGKQCREKWDKLISEYKDVVDGRKEKADSPYFPELQLALERGRKKEKADSSCFPELKVALMRGDSDYQRDADVPCVASEKQVIHT